MIQFPSPVTWCDLTAPELNALAARGAIVLVPVGSTEQHGPHLVTGTDFVLAGEVCRRSALELQENDIPCVVTPAVWMGLAAHHIEFGGTFSLSLATFAALLVDICGSIVKAGFGRIVLVNGHGGNMAALSAVATDISSRTGQRIFTTTYFIEAEQEIASILEEQSNLQHACEGETSMMWALSPDHVRPSALCDGPDFELSHVLQPSLRAFEPFSRITQNGVSGAATNADAKKGERLLAAAAHALTRCLATQCHQDALIAS